MDNRQFIQPCQVPADDQFFHGGVVCILHRDQTHRKVVPARQLFHFIRLVVGHQEITLQRLAQCEELIVVDRVMRVEPPSGALAARGVGRIDEVDRLSV